ncbi:MAG TPA: protease [bacterium]|nr:protease [bacterium]
MKKRFLAVSLCLMAVQILYAMEEARLLRFPAVYQDQIVFGYAGDLYTVDSKGGIARRLTSHTGYECFPRFSPDGRTVAFTGQYDGNTEVFIMPARGGVPRRLTFTSTLGRDNISDRMGPNNIVMGWKPGTDEIIFRSRMKSYNDFNGQLYTVSLQGDLPDQIPVPRGGFCSFSSDGGKMAYNRIFREFRTWKRYRGGMADDIWIYDFKAGSVTNLTDHPAQDIIPMWHGDRIYFLSDRDNNMRMNLYVHDLNSGNVRKLTDFSEYDIKFPSLGVDAIVFEYGGYIYRFDLAAEEAVKVPVMIANDQIPARPVLIDVNDRIQQFEIAPDGARALFVARGDLYTVPAEHGRTRILSNTSGIHERSAKWSPDGRWIAFVSDATGEDEIYIMPQDGIGEPIQLTRGGETYKYQPVWSPDSKKLLWADRRQRLRMVNIDSKKMTEVAHSKAFEIRQYTWSPDSRWIAFTMPEVETPNRIYLYSLDTGKATPVTDVWHVSSSPEFSRDGKYLFFVSNRDFNPEYSWTEWNHIYQDMSRIYLLTLSKSVKSPFLPRNDEVKIGGSEEENQKDGSGKAGKKEDKKELAVDLEGLEERIVDMPIKAAAYGSLASAGDKLYYLRRGRTDEHPVLLMYDLEARKETELGSVNGFEVSADGKKMLIAHQGKYGVIPLPSAPVKIEKPLDLSGLKKKLNRHEEWAQVFEEVWRQMREFFYAPNMHGLDWEKTADRYRPLIPHVNHGADLTYVLGEMLGELSVGHSYVNGGDMPSPERIPLGLLGAELERHKPSGAYRIVRILPGRNWDESLRSPLIEVGVDVSEGDYILAVNGVPVAERVNIYESLVHTAGRQTVLKINSRPVLEGAREVVVIPVSNESNLYYLDWVHTNIRKVAEATNGKVGYLHIPDMSPAGLNEFVKYFYPQLRKKALIIDVRGNGGGNVSPMIIERLRREIAMVDMARNTAPATDPGEMIWGPKVCLLDEFSASDGDLFPYRFKYYKMGKLIGKRSWGGVVGIRGPLPLLDGTDLRKPEFAPYDPEGKGWIIEGYGVEPDIFVDNDPVKEYAGIDEQLHRAIEEIMEELRTLEKSLPPVPPYPDKTPPKK